MTAREAILRAYRQNTNDAIPLPTGSNEFAMGIELVNTAQAQWFSTPSVRWQTTYDEIVIGQVAANTQSYDASLVDALPLDRNDFVMLERTPPSGDIERRPYAIIDSVKLRALRYGYLNLGKLPQEYTFSPAGYCAFQGDPLKIVFSNNFEADDTIIGGNIIVPHYVRPSLVTTENVDTYQIAVNDPMYVVNHMIAELYRKGYVKERNKDFWANEVLRVLDAMKKENNRIRQVRSGRIPPGKQGPGFSYGGVERIDNIPFG